MGLLSAIGGLVGLAFGGPMGAALGSGIGTLASGGDIGDALKSGLMGYGIGSIPGVAGFAGQAASAAGAQGLAGKFGAAQQMAGQTAIGKMAGQLGAGVQAGMGGAPAAQGTVGQGLFGMPMQDLVLAGLLEAGEPKAAKLTPQQRRQVETGERVPDYRGTPAPDYRRGIAAMMNGGYIEGPGTGRSDSIPAAIYQNGGRVQEARLSDGEFVMTERAVRGLGNGNRAQGAAKMYQMMDRFEGMA